MTPDAKMLVVALRGAPASLVLIDTGDITTRRWVELRGGTTGHQWLSADGHHSFGAVEQAEGAGTIGVVDNRTGAVVAQHPYPLRQTESVAPRPHGVFYEPSVLVHPDRVGPTGSGVDGSHAHGDEPTPAGRARGGGHALADSYPAVRPS